MSAYTLVKFLHVSAAIGYFVAVGLLLFGLAALRRARRVEQVRMLAELVGRSGPLFGISILVILVAGLYMTFEIWSFQMGWIAVALVSLLLIAPIAGVIVESRRRVIARLAAQAQDGPLPATLLARIHDPVLVTTPRTVTALLLGIVFLMTNKPSLPVALLVMAIALVLGLAAGLLVSGTSRAGEQDMAADTTRVAHE